jgi:hypothetical protein
VPFHSLIVDPQYPNDIFCGNDLGTFYSTDGGSTWIAFNTGFPEAVMVFDLVVSPFDRGLLAYTHGHGVYKRSLNDILGIDGPNAPPIAMNIYPNPVSDILNLNITDSRFAKGELNIYDISGNTVINREVRSQRSEVEISNFAPGTYVLALNVNDKLTVKKFVVRH